MRDNRYLSDMAAASRLLGLLARALGYLSSTQYVQVSIDRPDLVRRRIKRRVRRALREVESDNC